MFKVFLALLFEVFMLLNIWRWINDISHNDNSNPFLPFKLQLLLGFGEKSGNNGY
jgi:hypothetical protein